MDIIQKPCASGNWAEGRGEYKPLAIVVHLMDGSLEGTDAWFNTPPDKRNNGGFASSAHYGVGKSGEVHQYVADTDRAYHAGRVLRATAAILEEHPGINPNLYTIGIEHEGTVEDDWCADLAEASAQLIAELSGRWSIPIDRTHIIGHHEIFNAKPCPGPKCPLDQIVARAAELTESTQETSTT